MQRCVAVYFMSLCRFRAKLFELGNHLGKEPKLALSLTLTLRDEVSGSEIEALLRQDEEKPIFTAGSLHKDEDGHE